MLIDNNGEVTLLFGGKERTFKFGFKSLSFYEQGLSEVNGTIENIALMLWAGLLAKRKENDLPEGFDTDTVMEWMDTAGEDDIADLFLIAKKRLDSLNKMGGKFQESASSPASQPEKKAL